MLVNPYLQRTPEGIGLVNILTSTSVRYLIYMGNVILYPPRAWT